MIKKDELSNTYENFKQECRLINLQKEYPGLVGTITWAISSDLSEIEIKEKYSNVIEIFSPFVFLTTDQLSAFKEFESNNRKHNKRYIELTDGYGYEEGLAEFFHKELSVNPFDDRWYYEKQNLKAAIEKLDIKQRQIVISHFFYGKTTRVLALEENISHQAISKGIERTLKILKRELL